MRWGHGSPARNRGLGLAQGLIAALLIELAAVLLVLGVAALAWAVLS